MQLSTSPKKGPRRSTGLPLADELGTDLKFISDLGRSLLSTVHPKKVANRVADAIVQGVAGAACVFAAELPNIGFISSSSTPPPSGHGDLLSRKRFEKWLSFLPPQVSYREADADEFFISDAEHTVEYVAPLLVDGDIRGLIAVGFSAAEDLTERRSRTIDAAAQVAALSLNLSAHFESALHNSIIEAREEHRKFTEVVLDSLPVSLYVVDRDYRIVTWNKHREIGEQGIPRETAIGRDVFNVLARYPQGRLRQEFERAFRTGEIERIEQQTVADDGSTRHWIVSKVPMRSAETGEVTHVITVGEDVTIRVEAMHAVARAEKLSAVGRLAAGVVHEINNPLATIAACAEALEERIKDGSFTDSDSAADLAEYLGLIKSEAFRCKAITNGLLDFSRVRAGERIATDLGEVLKAAANLIIHQKRGERIEFKVEVADDLPPVTADAGQIQQAVIALATNAIDAMPNGGTLELRVFPQDGRVVIEVSDTGIGIPPEDMPKIFEPFFTTKEVGRGTGLGLAVCYGIISDHGGRLNVRSKPRKGTTFSIYLPAAK
ncbi:MAG: PAS domain-containing protein [Chloracidobacterium sp.]|nr:PAS domain-containing protein [Chloracidobacterium sp.]MCC6824579.1 PAS domain-containing protein [Acidobacteriota bacterium]MCO5333711.1 ATP-binding protein [Pyrinomonadaceae bacterium]